MDCVKALLWRDAEGAMAPRYAARKYRFPLIRPAVPEPESWLPFLRDSYEHQWFSNFGPVVRQLETQLTIRICHPDGVITTAGNCTACISAAVESVLIRAPA